MAAKNQPVHYWNDPLKQNIINMSQNYTVNYLAPLLFTAANGLIYVPFLKITQEARLLLLLLKMY